MKDCVFVIALLAVLAAITEAGTPWESQAALQLQEAPYEVVAVREGYEERLYPSRKWVTTEMDGPSLDRKMNGMFMKLFRYISGGNSMSMAIDMTRPVSTLITPISASNHSFTMGFFLPEEHQNSPPMGWDDVVVEQRPRMTILTRRFDGFALDADVAMEAEELANAIIASGETDVDFSSYYVNSYDDPMTRVDRRNEVWYVKEVGPAPQM